MNKLSINFKVLRQLIDLSIGEAKEMGTKILPETILHLEEAYTPTFPLMVKVSLDNSNTAEEITGKPYFLSVVYAVGSEGSIVKIPIV